MRGCQTLGFYQYTHTHQLTVLLKLSGTSPDGSSKRGKGLDGRFGSLFKELLFEAGPRGFLFPVSHSGFSSRLNAFW